MIEAKLSQFTPRERKIADYFLHQSDSRDSADFSSKTIAAKLGVSEAALTRFAKKCGFHGFREFIYVFNQPEKASANDFTQPVLASYQELLNKTYSLVDMAKIRQITQLLLTKQKVFVYGKGSSGMVAQEMKLRFMRIGLNCEAITDDDMIRMHSVLVDKDCVVIGISISGATKIVIESLKAAKSHRASTILLTANESREFTDCFDIVQLFAIKNHLEYGRVISPQFPILVVLDMLYADYISTDREKREAIWQRTYDALQHNRP